MNNVEINSEADFLETGLVRKNIYAIANPILGYSAQDIIDFYSNGNRGHFHCSFEPGPTSKASAVEIEVKNGNYLEFDRGSGFKERELATGDSRV